MGYYKQEQVEQQVEEVDRVPPPKPASVHVALHSRPITRKSVKQQQRELAKQATGKFLLGHGDLALIILGSLTVGALTVIAMWVNS